MTSPDSHEAFLAGCTVQRFAGCEAPRVFRSSRAEVCLVVSMHLYCKCMLNQLECPTRAAAGNGAKAAADDGGWGDAWGDDATPCAQQPLATPARSPSIAQPDLLNATQRPSLDGDKAPADAASSACDTAIRGHDIERALVMCEDDGADVSLQPRGPNRRNPIFGRRNKNKENKEPAPHTEPQTKWVMYAGTCKVAFGWSVGSQAHCRTENKPPPRFCCACANQRNNKRKRALHVDT
jgi:hypothetical protein